MTRKIQFLQRVVVIGAAALLAAAPTRLSAQQTAQSGIRIGEHDLGGVVTGKNGPEGGVWVIAETNGLPTAFAKIVVTDDQGRYVVPDLPQANYDVWARGYGLVDSPRVVTTPGKTVNLTAVPTPNAAAAAQHYPSIYWFSMLSIPDESNFSGPNRDENMPENIKSHTAWLNIIKTTGCIACHGIGTLGTRTVPAALGHFDNSAEAWARRIQSGQAENNMVSTISRLDPQLAFQYFGDWTDRIAKGELPFAQPPRPQGIERNIVLTLWDWSRETAYMHDLTPTDRRNPTVNANGKLYGTTEDSTDYIPVLDPAHNSASEIKHPASGKFTLISTCFPTHHLNFATDVNQTLWTSAGGAQTPVVGWLNRKVLEETGDEQKAQGWSPFILDTNGNGKRDDYVEPNQPVDPIKDKRVVAGLYSVSVNPFDGTIWGTSLGYPGYVVRVNPGPDPTHTALTEIYEPPLPGYGPRGGDIDSKGVFWASLASGHFASFDRSKCKVLNGPTATGKHCAEGWTLYPFPGPQFKGVSDPGSAESSYYTWVDQFNTLGLGKDVPIATGNLNSALLALVDGKFVTLRVPYVNDYFTKGMDGRIDDANAGWKGRALWTTYATRTMFHLETGKGTMPKVVRFQLRPDPLAN